jgi:hypothetical protein
MHPGRRGCTSRNDASRDSGRLRPVRRGRAVGVRLSITPHVGSYWSRCRRNSPQDLLRIVFSVLVAIPRGTRSKDGKTFPDLPEAVRRHSRWVPQPNACAFVSLRTVLESVRRVQRDERNATCQNKIGRARSPVWARARDAGGASGSTCSPLMLGQCRIWLFLSRTSSMRGFAPSASTIPKCIFARPHDSQ